MEIAPHLCHLINSIIRTNIIPECLKISRITPILKPDKLPNDMASYRPINNLPCIEKIIEEHILRNLTSYLEDNNILHPNLHGGRKGHSTTTALLQITERLNKSYDKNLITTTLLTDLSAAFDTVDHEILLSKLSHYGIVGNENILLKNYMSNRKQFVQIDTFRSDTLDSLNCSVVQGSKLSGILYNLYTNEIPLLHEFMIRKEKNPFKVIHNPKYKKVDHLTVNFVDDSTNLISFKETNDIKAYISQYYEILHQYYTANKLKINSDKTKLMINCKPRFATTLKNFFFYGQGI